MHQGISCGLVKGLATDVIFSEIDFNCVPYSFWSCAKYGLTYLMTQGLSCVAMFRKLG